MLKRRAGLAHYAFLCGLLICMVLVGLAGAYHYFEARSHFNSKVGFVRDDVLTRLKAAEEGIQGIYTLFSSTETVEADQYRLFAENLLQRHAFVKSISFHPLVMNDRRDAFQNTLREEGWGGIEIKALEDERIRVSSAREFYFPVLHHEPLATLIEETVGFDLHSISAYQPIFERAIRDAKIESTAPARFSDGTQGIAMFKAVYSTGQAVLSEKYRARQVKGVLVLRLDLKKLMSQISLSGDMNIFIDAVKHQSRNDKEGLIVSRFFFSETIELPGRTVKLGVAQYIHVHEVQYWLVVVALVAGTVLSFLLYVLGRNVELRNRYLRQRNEEVEKLARLKTQQLAQEQQRAQVTLSAIADGVVAVDADLKIEYLNPAAEKLSGYVYEEVKGLPVKECIHLVDDKANEPMLSTLEQCVEEKGLVTRKGVGAIVDRHGGVVAIDESASPVLDEKDAVSGAVLVIRDVSYERHLTETMTYRATHDALTGLPNRILLIDHLEQQLQQAEAEVSHVAVMFLDLDGFKFVNDNYGHDIGDALLVLVANRLKAALREVDMVCRLGGDEFVVVLHGVEGENAIRSMAERLIEAMNKRFDLKGQAFATTTSIGIAIHPQAGDTPEVLIKHADAAMYRAKSLGKNRFVFYTHEQEERDQPNHLHA